MMSAPNDESLPRGLVAADDDRGATAAQTSAEAWGLADAVARLFAALINVDVVGAEALHLHHENGQFGYIAADDILEGRLRVIDPRTGEVSAYEHIEAIAVGGWTVAA